MDSYHLACGCMSLLFAVAGALLLRRESESKAPPSHLSYLFPRVLLVGSLLGCIENAALVSLSMLNDSFSPIYYDALTIGADTAADFLVLTGALSSGAFSFHHCTGIATALYCRVTHGDFTLGCMFYITASSAAAAADIMLDPNRMLWIHQISTWWFAFDVLACLTSCSLRPLTNLESFGLIFYVYNWFGRTLVIVFVAHQTIKLRNHVLALGPQGEAIAARLSNFFLLVIAGHTGFIVLYTQSVLRCYRLLSGLGTLPYFHRERAFDITAVFKIALLGVVLLFILRSNVCIPTPSEDTKYAALNTRPPQDAAPHDAPEEIDVEMDDQV